MLKKLNLEKLLFLDIETVPEVYKFEDIDDKTRELFESKTRFMRKEDTTYDMIYDQRAGIYAEFGKIVCISVGFVTQTPTGKQMRMKSYYHEDEETLLLQFKKVLEENCPGRWDALCGHNAKEFDFPYICRRMLIHGIELPHILDIAGKKPWEINHIDTMELWKFGDFKAYTSLALLCHVFKIPTPKDDISGADVARVYYEEQDLERIKVYCEKDVVALIQLLLKMKGEALIEEAEIHYSE